MADRVTDEDLELLGELGVEVAPEDKGGRTPREQRVIAGFEEIERFHDEHGHAPQHGEDRDIFERLYAVRLDRIRESGECRAILKGLDRRGLLGESPRAGTPDAADGASDDELLAALGVGADAATDDSVSKLVHVRSNAERAAAEDVARRTPCADFETFRPVFETVQRELDAGERRTAAFARRDSGDGEDDFKVGDLFVIGGQKALIANVVGESVDKPLFPGDRRMRVIFDNGTEATLWLRSLKRARYEEGNRKILPRDDVVPPLFADHVDDGDAVAGSIYVLRSRSDHPFVAAHRDLIHKIGVTGGGVRGRLGNARKDPTYLLADVEVVAEYKLANVNRKALEALLHRFFANVRLDVELKDRFGSQVEPKEWFLVPLLAIDEAIGRIKDGTIGRYRYDEEGARLTEA
jgi:hypothetical protein